MYFTAGGISNLTWTIAISFENILIDSPSILKELEKTAKSRNVPIVGPMIGRLLYIFASVSNAKHILEIGTAIGYSAIWLGLAVKRNKGRVKTIEIDRDIANEAIKNIRRAGLAKIVEVINGNALKILPKINDKFEIIFIDDRIQKLKLQEIAQKVIAKKKSYLTAIKPE